MSIPGSRPLVAQLSQPAVVSLYGRFANLFLNRVVAVAAIALTSIVGGFCALDGTYALLQKTPLKGTFIQTTFCVLLTVVSVTALNILLTKCVNIRFTPLEIVFIASSSFTLAIIGKPILSKFLKRT